MQPLTFQRMTGMTTTAVHATAAHSTGAGTSTVPPNASAQEPFIYSVASRLHCLQHLSRDRQLGIWKRVLDLYTQTNRAVPKLLKDLCHESHIEAILTNEVFWRMTEMGVNRQSYARATDYLPALFATAALLAAERDALPLLPEDRSLLA